MNPVDRLVSSRRDVHVLQHTPSQHAFAGAAVACFLVGGGRTREALGTR
jgi:hypothetical protein